MTLRVVDPVISPENPEEESPEDGSHTVGRIRLAVEVAQTDDIQETAAKERKVQEVN
jgi:hypothetical protein